MRDVLLKRVRPLVERLAADLTELAVRRMEADLERIKESLEVALSAYQSDDAPDLLAAALGPELAAMLAGGVAPRENKLPAKGRTSGIPARAEATESKSVVETPVSETVSKCGAPRASGKGGFITCSKCGFVGGNARGCGRAHPTLERPPSRPAYIAPEREITRGPVVTISPTIPPRRAKADPDAQPMTAIAPARRLSPTPEALAAARERIAHIAARNTTTNGPAAAPARDDNENAEERWSPRRIDDERQIAEDDKHAGVLPVPRSSFIV